MSLTKMGLTNGVGKRDPKSEIRNPIYGKARPRFKLKDQVKIISHGRPWFGKIGIVIGVYPPDNIDKRTSYSVGFGEELSIWSHYFEKELEMVETRSSHEENPVYSKKRPPIPPFEVGDYVRVEGSVAMPICNGMIGKVEAIRYQPYMPLQERPDERGHIKVGSVSEKYIVDVRFPTALFPGDDESHGFISTDLVLHRKAKPGVGDRIQVIYPRDKNYLMTGTVIRHANEVGEYFLWVKLDNGVEGAMDIDSLRRIGFNENPIYPKRRHLKSLRQKLVDKDIFVGYNTRTGQIKWFDRTGGDYKLLLVLDYPAQSDIDNAKWWSEMTLGERERHVDFQIDFLKRSLPRGTETFENNSIYPKKRSKFSIGQWVMTDWGTRGKVTEIVQYEGIEPRLFRTHGEASRNPVMVRVDKDWIWEGFLKEMPSDNPIYPKKRHKYPVGSEVMVIYQRLLGDVDKGRVGNIREVKVHGEEGYEGYVYTVAFATPSGVLYGTYWEEELKPVKPGSGHSDNPVYPKERSRPPRYQVGQKIYVRYGRPWKVGIIVNRVFDKQQKWWLYTIKIPHGKTSYSTEGEYEHILIGWESMFKQEGHPFYAENPGYQYGPWPGEDPAVGEPVIDAHPKAETYGKPAVVKEKRGLLYLLRFKDGTESWRTPLQVRRMPGYFRKYQENPIYPKGRPEPEAEIPNLPANCAPGPIRRYGPGKFNTILDSLVYGSETDQDIGSTDELGAYGLIELNDLKVAKEFLAEIWRTAVKFGEAPLTKDECALILKTRRIILREGEQGFVDVEYLDMFSGDARWHEINKEYEEFYSGQGEQSE
jgi:hypothetical protein